MLESRALLRTLDLLRIGIVMTDASSRIVHENRLGRTLVADGTALMRCGGNLTARDRRSASALTEAIAIASRGCRIPKLGIPVPIAGVDGPDLVTWVLPLGEGAILASEASVVVFVRTLGDRSPFPAEIFESQFGATPAECRVLDLITQGMTVRDAAASLGISLSTVRSHLRNLFQKTGTQRQAELVRLAAGTLVPAST